MGGDYAPGEIVKGALAAVGALPIDQGHIPQYAISSRPGEGIPSTDVEVLLVGDRDAVEGELSRYGKEAQSIRVIPSEGKITDDEHPVHALRHKPKASITVATQLLKNGEADALVSMGSTGATMASAALLLGTLEGLERPCVGGPFLGLAPRTVVVDMGSNVDCRPALLLDFAAMGCVFARSFLGIEDPKVGLLSVGSEEAKGNRQIKEGYQLFKEGSLNFVGNVEGMDFFTDKADVIVCDGFIGNILIKFAEGLGSALVPYLRRHLSEILPAEQVRQIGEALWTTTNLPRTMGGPLFGVDGLVMIGHGSSTADGVAGAINTGLLCHRLELVEGFRQELVGLHRAAVPEA
jgi:glycerol-3-phosphate acyltransferase PlsX